MQLSTAKCSVPGRKREGRAELLERLVFGVARRRRRVVRESLRAPTAQAATAGCESLNR